MIANEEPAGKKYFPLAFSVFQFAKGVHPPDLATNFHCADIDDMISLCISSLAML